MMLPSLRLVQMAILGAPLWLLALLIPYGWIPATLYLAILSGLCVRDAASSVRETDLSIEREMPPRFRFDEDHSIGLLLTNRSDHDMKVRVRDELPACFDADARVHQGVLPARGQVRITYNARTTRRGTWSFGDTVIRAEHGLGLLQRQYAFKVVDEIKVYPRYRDVGAYELLAKIAQRDEIVRRPRLIRGAGSDFESLRAYMPGEDLRHVDWKASSRHGTLISRNRQVERGQQLAVLLDTGRLMGEAIGPYPKLEYAISATVMLSYIVQKRGDSMAVVSFCNQIESFMPTSRGPSLVSSVLESLYKVESKPVESDYWQATAEVMALLRRRSLVIMLTDILDGPGSAGLINNLARASAKHLVLCVVLSNPEVRAAAHSTPSTPEEVYYQAAACDLLRRRRIGLERMQSRGIFVLETDPERFSVNLVRRYLEIRQADLQ
jgi:uncharacterized protein (DUF58 family)